MKQLMFIACAVMLTGCNQQVDHNNTAILDIENDKVKFSYAIGMDADIRVLQTVSKVDRAALIAGINDGLDGAEMKINQQELNRIRRAISQKQVEKRAAEMKAVGEKNKAEYAMFLAEHANKEGVRVTASGLQYEVIKQGSGPRPRSVDDVVKVLYSGTLSDGTIFNPWHKNDEPEQRKLGKFLPVLVEGLQLMNIGSVYRFVVPPGLAYGEKGAGANIPPYSVMVFEFELLSIEEDKQIPGETAK